jgi:hydroxymethylpyrimidine/phosphomethylpyrimidine kinase
MTTSTNLQSERHAAVLPLQLLRQQMDAVLSQVETGTLKIDSILSQSDLDEASSVLYACKLIEVVPGIGKVKARHLLAKMNVSETEQTGNLTLDQRNKLVQLIATEVIAS